MRSCSYKTGLTFIELLVAIGLVAILITMVIGIGRYIHTQTEYKVLESELSVLVSAVGQYYEYWELFPPDCCDFTQAEMETLLQGNITGGTYNRQDSSSIGMYFYLSKTPKSRRLLDTISSSLVTSENPSGQKMIITINGRKIDLNRVIDPWQMSLKYSYAAGDNFPRIRSAGPDKKFNTKDDITSRGK